MRVDAVEDGIFYISISQDSSGHSICTVHEEPNIFRGVSRRTKAEAFCTMIRQTVLYVSETWRLTKRLEGRLHEIEYEIQQKICGLVYGMEEEG